MMKKILTAPAIFFFAFFINNSFAQSKTNIIKTGAIQSVSSKPDSTQLKQAEVNAFVEQVVKTISIIEFQQWCYKKNDR